MEHWTPGDTDPRDDILRRRLPVLEGGRDQIGMVAGFRSEGWPRSNRNRWPACVGICIKDRDTAANRTVPLGDGDVPWAAELTRLLTEAAKAPAPIRQIQASIETHCPQDARTATARSVAALRRIAAEIGVEVV